MADAWVEIERRDAEPIFGHEFPCLGCGKGLRLWFNGGELDGKDCCGFRYELEHVKIDFVISKKQNEA